MKATDYPSGLPRQSSNDSVEPFDQRGAIDQARQRVVERKV